jgi:hypothetical protein
MTGEQVCSSQKPLLTIGFWTRDLWFYSLDLRPLGQPAVKWRTNESNERDRMTAPSNLSLCYFVGIDTATLGEFGRKTAFGHRWSKLWMWYYSLSTVNGTSHYAMQNAINANALKIIDDIQNLKCYIWCAVDCTFVSDYD